MTMWFFKHVCVCVCLAFSGLVLYVFCLSGRWRHFFRWLLGFLSSITFSFWKTKRLSHLPFVSKVPNVWRFLSLAPRLKYPKLLQPLVDGFSLFKCLWMSMSFVVWAICVICRSCRRLLAAPARGSAIAVLGASSISTLQRRPGGEIS